MTTSTARGQAITPEKLNLGADYALTSPPPALAPKGWLAAWDPITGTERWRVPHPVPVNGGVLSTPPAAWCSRRRARRLVGL